MIGALALQTVFLQWVRRRNVKPRLAQMLVKMVDKIKLKRNKAQPQNVRKSCTASCARHLCPMKSSPFYKGRLQSVADWLYLLDVFEGLNRGMAQGVQVGL